MENISAFDTIQSHSLRILSLDDDPVIKHVLHELFGEEYRYKHAFTVGEFYDLFDSFQPDIILVDLNLPDGNGISVCKRIRNTAVQKSLYILIMTSESDERTVVNAYNAGVDDYIRKPFFPFEVKTKIRIITENIISRKHLKNLYSGVKLFNQKLYRLTKVINKNINEITKHEIMSSIEDVINLIETEYCEIIIFGTPSQQQLVSDKLEPDTAVPYSKLVKMRPSILQSELEHDKLKIRSREKLLHIHIFKIYFNREKSGFVILESQRPIAKESLELIKLYLDFINMKGTDIQLKDRLKREIEKERKEISRVRTIQVSLLPDFKDIPGYEIASSFIPMEEISGDFFDGFYINEHIYQFVVCDVCGHGMPSSYVGSAIRSIIRSISNDIQSLSGIVTTLNGILTQTAIDTAYFATLFMWQIDFKSCKMHYLSAGHPDALLFESDTGNLTELKSTGPLVGIFPESEYEERELLFRENDVLFAYTDGLIEATDPVTNDMFRLQRLKKVFLQSLRYNRSIDIIHTVLGAVYSFTDYGIVDDDVTIICLQKKSACPER
ncbi:MAG: SpoIIE family protein phosphatase [Spirochaetota bacterium]